MPLADNSLGRSLQDVFARTPRREGGKGYLEVELSLITAPRANPRTEFDEDALKQLAESIKQHGLLQPIVVLRREVGFEILSGERRWRAARLAGLDKIPVVVRDESDPQHQAELRLIENIQREQLNPMELARAYQALLSEHSLTHEALAIRLNKERATISNALRLLSLPDDVQKQVAGGELSGGHARALLAVADQAQLRDLARRVIAEGLSVREVERLAKQPVASAEGAAVGKPPHIKELEANLQHLFGSKVGIRERNGKGAITVQFESKDHYLRVVTLLERFIRQANLDKAGVK
jgi:ParB family transcriptional regulator, chromosome partitioning protein